MSNQFEVNLKFAPMDSSCTIMVTSAMIDSGATANFVFEDFIKSLPIPALNLFSPQVVGADRKVLSPAAKGCCYQLTIWLTQKHRSDHMFCALPTSH